MTETKITYVRFEGRTWKRTELPWISGYRPIVRYEPVEETEEQRNTD